MAARNPASVLPEPVGAQISVCLPATIAGQPPAWASVGPSGNRRSNHTRTAGWNRSRAPGAMEAVGGDDSELEGTSQTLAFSPALSCGRHDAKLRPAGVVEAAPERQERHRPDHKRKPEQNQAVREHRGYRRGDRRPIQDEGPKQTAVDSAETAWQGEQA